MEQRSNNYVAIMAGGVGSRFWPASRQAKPKQFLDITECGASLLQQTVNRLLGLVPIENVLIVSNNQYADQIMEQLPMLHKSQLLLEPTRNNTAPGVAYTALHLQALDPKAVFAVLPADHIIEKEDTFLAALKKGFAKAGEEEAIVTLGITPTRPDTGYGYIDYDAATADNGIYKVNSFKEKPDKKLAKEYVSKGGYLWNAGIFIWSCQTILNAFDRSAEQIVQVLRSDMSKYGSEDEQTYINKVYPLTKSISVDFAILEHATNVFTIPVDIGWSDLGTWNSLYYYLEKDKNDNAVLSRHSQLIGSRGNLIRTRDKDKLIVAKGLENYIIIDEEDVLLIYPRNDEQEIKQVREGLKNKRFV